MNEEQIRQIISAIQSARRSAPFVLAVEGGSGSGKSTLSRLLAEKLNCPLIHTDDFFLPPKLRTPKRLCEIGGNIHYERLNKEVAEPLRQKKDITYRVFSCRTMDYTKTVPLALPELLILEGVYSMHPAVRDVLSLCLYVEADFDVRIRRIEGRSGKEKLPRFLNEWIPMENRYFDYYKIKEHCDFVITNNEEK